MSCEVRKRKSSHTVREKTSISILHYNFSLPVNTIFYFHYFSLLFCDFNIFCRRCPCRTRTRSRFSAFHIFDFSGFFFFDAATIYIDSKAFGFTVAFDFNILSSANSIANSFSTFFFFSRSFAYPKQHFRILAGKKLVILSGNFLSRFFFCVTLSWRKRVKTVDNLPFFLSVLRIWTNSDFCQLIWWCKFVYFSFS